MIFNQIYCPNKEDYSPCDCSELALHCWNVSIDDIRQLVLQKAQSNKTVHVLELFHLTTQLSEYVMVPANFLAKYLVTSIELKCATTNDTATQRMNRQDAFRSSENITRVISITSCNLSELDFSFLKGFSHLDTLSIDLVANFYAANWTTLPSLLSLKTLKIQNSDGVNEWTQYPNLVNGLTELTLINCGIDDISINRILKWLLDSSSSVMEQFDVGTNELNKEIPWALLSSFKELKILSK